jgi:hypothetical protein
MVVLPALSKPSINILTSWFLLQNTNEPSESKMLENVTPIGLGALVLGGRCKEKGLIEK